MHLEKILNLYTSFGTVKHLAETVETEIRPPIYYFIYVVHECHDSTFTNKNSNTPRIIHSFESAGEMSDS